jgi:GNAT superfamily N-acetyltransferase
MSKRYTLSDLKVTTFRACDSVTRAAYETFVRGLTLELDNEPGDDPEKGTWVWVQENNATMKDGDPFDTFIFIERRTGEIVATASFVRDDRGVATRLGLDKSPEYLGIWGFFLTRRDLRRHGLGTIISAYVDRHVQKFTNKGGKPRLVYLFTMVPHAMKVYERLGFVRQNEVVSLEEFGFDEYLYKKEYLPATGKKRHKNTKRRAA